MQYTAHSVREECSKISRDLYVFNGWDRLDVDTGDKIHVDIICGNRPIMVILVYYEQGNWVVYAHDRALQYLIERGLVCENNLIKVD
jgi:hypothetical protein